MREVHLCQWGCRSVILGPLFFLSLKGLPETIMEVESNRLVGKESYKEPCFTSMFVGVGGRVDDFL